MTAFLAAGPNQGFRFVPACGLHFAIILPLLHLMSSALRPFVKPFPRASFHPTLALEPFPKSPNYSLLLGKGGFLSNTAIFGISVKFLGGNNPKKVTIAELPGYAFLPFLSGWVL